MAKLTIQQAMRVGVEHHQAGRLDRAESMYRQVLARAPQYPDALHLLGVLASQNGNSQAAIGLIERAIAVDPSAAEFHNNLGEAHRLAGNIERAAACFRAAIERKSDYADAHSNLGVTLDKLGKPQEALACWRKAAELDPGNAEAFYNAGVVLVNLQNPDNAITLLRRAIQLRPDYAQAHSALGDALQLAGKSAEAVAAYQQFVRIQGGSADDFHALGDALARSGHLKEAIESFQKVRDLQPHSPDVHNNLGVLLERSGRFEEAIREYEQAIRLGDSPEAHNNLGNYFGLQSNLDRAVEEFRTALNKDPSFYEAHSNLANALVELGQLASARAEYHKALQLKPGFAGIHSNLLLAMLYSPEFTPRQLFDEHRRWDELYAAPLRNDRVHANGRAAGRKLRLAYLSPDFRAHAVSFFSLPVLEGHDKTQFEVVCYSNSVSTDLITKRFQSRADAWHNIAGLSDHQAAELIRSHRIDILVDLAGHTASNRMPLMAMKPAPVQVSAWGYPHTTGLSAMDYRITDACCDPPGVNEAHNAEKLLRLEGSFWCYQPPLQCPDVNGAPAVNSGRVTFASLNNLAKVTPDVIGVWARILQQVPDARLIVKANGLGSRIARQYVEETFAANGIGAERLRLEGRGGFGEFLQLFHEIDIALDPFPFNGGTTTCHTLWMGVPVVSLEGLGHMSRMGVSVLGNIGLPELIARDTDRYVQIAVDLARDWDRLIRLRSEMRPRLLASPLLDRERFVRQLEAQYRHIWQQWCSGRD